MKLTYEKIYKYSQGKQFRIYKDEQEKYYLEKETAKKNYDFLLRLAEIAVECENLLQIEAFYTSEENSELLKYFVTFHSGMTLQEYIDKKIPLTRQEIDNIIYGICNALKVLHAKDIIHRDIKPDNVMIVEDNKVKVIDYDISREFSQVKDNDTVYAGTPGFAAPEQYGFQQTTNKTDIYAVGKTIEKVIEACNNQEKFNYQKIINKCCELDPDNRYDNVTDILRDLFADEQKFSLGQIEQLVNGEEKGLSSEQIAVYRKIEYNAQQMGVIKHALLENIDPEVIELLGHVEFSSRQMYQIKLGAEQGLTIEQIKRYAKEFYNPYEMSFYRHGLLNNYAIEDIYNICKFYKEVEEVERFSSERLALIRLAIFQNMEMEKLRMLSNRIFCYQEVQKIYEILQLQAK